MICYHLLLIFVKEKREPAVKLLLMKRKRATIDFLHLLKELGLCVGRMCVCSHVTVT